MQHEKVCVLCITWSLFSFLCPTCSNWMPLIGHVHAVHAVKGTDHCLTWQQGGSWLVCYQKVATFHIFPWGTTVHPRGGMLWHIRELRLSSTPSLAQPWEGQTLGLMVPVVKAVQEARPSSTRAAHLYHWWVFANLWGAHQVDSYLATA